MQKGLLTGMFFHHASVMNAHKELYRSGYNTCEISMVMAIETWEKHFRPGGHHASKGREDQAGTYACNCGSFNCGNSPKLTEAIRRSVLMPGLGVLLIGPIGHQRVFAEKDRLSVGLTRSLEKWGLPHKLSVGYAEEVLCGGTIIGVKTRHAQQDLNTAARWQKKQSNQVYIIPDALRAQKMTSGGV